MHLECRPIRVGSSRGAEEAECNREYRILFCDVHHYRLCWSSLLGESVGGVFSSCLFLHLHGRHHQPARLDGLGHPREAIVSPSKLLPSSTLLSKFSIFLQHFFSTLRYGQGALLRHCELIRNWFHHVKLDMDFVWIRASKRCVQTYKRPDSPLNAISLPSPSRTTCYTIALYAISTGVLVGSWLFGIQHFPCSISLRVEWSLCGSFNKEHLCIGSLRVKLIFGMSRGA